MKLVIFGLTVSSSWGNGHATLWRALCRALAGRGHRVVFFERDVPYYARHRDLTALPGLQLYLYAGWEGALPLARQHLADADVAMVTSYCPDGIAAADLVLSSPTPLRVFYDMDTPVTLTRLRAEEQVDYLSPHGLGDFDLVLSFTGGVALEELKTRLGARRVAPLYGSVDPEVHRPVPATDAYRADLSYLGTYAEDRQPTLNALFIEAARRLPRRRFVIGGALYPQGFPWAENIFFVHHLPPAEHPAFFSSSRLTLNVTRRAMAQMGHCPSGRLFEAAACGVPVLSDWWEGLDEFFAPGREILIARATEDTIGALQLPDEQLARIARLARQRVFDEHTAGRRSRGGVGGRQVSAGRLLQALQDGTSSGGVRGMWGIVPAAGMGSRIQPLAFSKELLPVGSSLDGGRERPRAVSEYLIERLIAGGVSKLCFVIAVGKADILQYYGGSIGAVPICYVVQPRPAGLCDAIFRALPLVHPEECVAVGLPDTIWCPGDALATLDGRTLSFLLFPVERPELFDAVVTEADGRVREIQVKRPGAASSWVWGAFKMPGAVLHELFELWCARDRRDEYIGTLVNAYLERGGEARAVRAGRAYVDVGTLHGYREAIQLLSAAPQDRRPAMGGDRALTKSIVPDPSDNG
jgi:spore maturation protein CgeB/dTDP-glucose pyrophosphorylase